MKTHQKVEGLGLKVIHRLDVDGYCGVAVLYRQDLWITSDQNKKLNHFASYGPRKTSTTVDNLSRVVLFL